MNYLLLFLQDGWAPLQVPSFKHCLLDRPSIRYALSQLYTHVSVYFPPVDEHVEGKILPFEMTGRAGHVIAVDRKAY